MKIPFLILTAMIYYNIYHLSSNTAGPNNAYVHYLLSIDQDVSACTE